jgi:phosphoserine aminotransferase
MWNTPPTFAWYLAGLVFRVALKSRAGWPRWAATAIATRPRALYAAIDGSGFLRQSGGSALPVVDERAVHARRTTRWTRRKFLEESKAAGPDEPERAIASVGGMRASLYNAMPRTGVDGAGRVHGGVRSADAA